jgi:hypothetical protein
MANRIAHGLAAGAVGTTALNVVTYADMALRGRPSSDVPERDVEELARVAKIDLGSGEKAESRKQGLGALIGYASGLSIGAAVGLAGPVVRRLPRPLAATAVGLGAMAATDGATAVLGVSDPRTWSTTDWVSDLVPHLVFGAATVAAYRALDG